MKKLFNQKGFTLVELLLYMAIFSIVTIVTVQMFGSVFDAQLESEATSSVATDGRYIISRFSYDVGRAESITTPVSAGDSGTTLALVIGGATLTYSLTGEDLLLANSSLGTSDQLNSSGTRVTNASFTRITGADDKDLIQFTFTLTSEATLRAQTQTMNFVTTKGLR